MKDSKDISHNKIDTYIFDIATTLHKTGKSAFTIDDICNKVKEMVVEEELVDEVVNGVKDLLINKYNYELTNTNVLFNIKM